MMQTRRKGRGKAQVPRSMPPPGMGPVQRVREIAKLAGITGAPSSPPYANAYSFTLGSLPQASSYATLYQFFRITKITLKFVLRYDPASVTVASTPQAQLPQLFVVVDQNDASVPSTSAELLAYGNCKIWVFTTSACEKQISWKPSLGVSPVGGGTLTEMGGGTQWTATSSTTSAYYGIKYVLENYAVTSTILDVYGIYDVEFCGTK